MLLAQALGEYGLAAMMSALRTAAATVELEVRQNPTPVFVGVALVVLVWWLLKKN